MKAQEVVSDAGSTPAISTKGRAVCGSSNVGKFEDYSTCVLAALSLKGMNGFDGINRWGWRYLAGDYHNSANHKRQR